MLARPGELREHIMRPRRRGFGGSVKNFQPHEFACNDGCGGGYSDMDDRLLAALDEARSLAGIPFLLTSAYRCKSHNAAVGGVSNSSHTTGHAVDILARGGREKWIILNALVSAGFTRIGIAGSFIHVDNDPSKTPRVIWDYG